jgi:nickel-dependent lactate racemase
MIYSLNKRSWFFFSKKKKNKNLKFLLKTGMHNSNDSTDWTNWIQESINKKHIKYYDHKHFSKFEEIGRGSSGRVFRARWKDSEQYFALKSFFNFDNVAIKELAHEVTTK